MNCHLNEKCSVSKSNDLLKSKYLWFILIRKLGFLKRWSLRIMRNLQNIFFKTKHQKKTFNIIRGARVLLILAQKQNMVMNIYNTFYRMFSFLIWTNFLWLCQYEQYIDYHYVNMHNSYIITRKWIKNVLVNDRRNASVIRWQKVMKTITHHYDSFIVYSLQLQSSSF